MLRFGRSFRFPHAVDDILRKLQRRVEEKFKWNNATDLQKHINIIMLLHLIQTKTTLFCFYIFLQITHTQDKTCK